MAAFRPIGKIGHHNAIIVTATIEGEKYQDQWIEQEVRLKYYLKAESHRGRKRYNENSPGNRSIKDFPELPILVFVKKQDRPSLYSYHGIFKSTRVVTEPDGAKWFDLIRH